MGCRRLEYRRQDRVQGFAHNNLPFENRSYADVSVQLAAMKVNINEISSRETKDGRSQISMTITVSNVDHLKNVIARLKKVDGVLSVER